MKFYKCEHCGNVITKLTDKGVPVVCCGTPMTELKAGSVDASKEKHVPIYSLDGNKVFVMVGDVEHPMEAEHYIEWILIETKLGTQMKRLSPGEKPAASFCLATQDALVAVYAYCNLHGLWEKAYEAPVVCDLKPVDTDTNENYVVCLCNKVKYFDILNAAQSNKDLSGLLNIFDEVKNTTHCSTGCGGCYNKVLDIISEILNGKMK